MIKKLTILFGLVWGVFSGFGGSDRVAWLEGEIERHDRLYWELREPEISDEAYDKLVEELRFWKNLEGGEESERLGRMGSLEKVYGEAELKKWMSDQEREGREGKIQYRLEPKVDGVAISLNYREGKLVSASTRGDGKRGENVLEQIVKSKVVPLKLGGELADQDIEIRGEIFMGKREWEEMEEGRRAVSPRHEAAAYLSRDGFSGDEVRGFGFFPYDLGRMELGGVETRTGLAELWGGMGFEEVTEWVVVGDRHEILAQLEPFSQKVLQSNYPSDGVVIKKESSYGSDFEDSIAYKFPGERGVTRLMGVVLQVGRLGTLTPVGLLEPIHLGGVRVSRVNLHHINYLLERDIRKNDWVLIERVGKAIPVLKEVIKERRRGDELVFTAVGLAESAGYEIEWDDEMGDWRLSEDHRDWQIQRLHHFVQSLGIPGMGPATLGRLVGEKGITEWDELLNYLYRDPISEDLPKVTREWLAKESHWQSIDLAQWILSWGIPGIGAKKAEVLAGAIGRFENLLKPLIVDAGDEADENLVNRWNQWRALNEKKLLRSIGWK